MLQLWRVTDVYDMAATQILFLIWSLSLVFVVSNAQVNIIIPVGSQECKDSIENCREYGSVTCSGIYLSWATSNCAATCGICTPSLTTEAPACVDHLSDCDTYQGDICTNVAYRGWAEGNCRKFCRFCTESQLNFIDSQTTTQATTKSPAACYDKFKCESFGSIACSIEKYGNWGQLNCPVFCGFCQGTTPTTTTAAPCVDTRPDCSTFQQDTCTNPLYKNWAESNCRKFCKFCGADQHVSTTPISTSASCVDVQPDCETFQEDTCTNPLYKSWAETNCRKFCKFCGTAQINVEHSSPFPSTTKTSHPVTSTKAPPQITTGTLISSLTFSTIATTTKRPPPITTTKAPPPITTTKAPPPATSTKAPPPVTTTKAPPPIITTKAPTLHTTLAHPPITTAKAPPHILTTRALTTSNGTTRTAVHLPPTLKTPPPLMRTSPSLLILGK